VATIKMERNENPYVCDELREIVLYYMSWEEVLFV
jgi:hypothetical protein